MADKEELKLLKAFKKKKHAEELYEQAKKKKIEWFVNQGADKKKAEKTYDALAEKYQEWSKTKQIRMRVPLTSLENIFKDGKIKNQIESGKTNAQGGGWGEAKDASQAANSKQQENRIKSEKKLFDVDDKTKLDPEDFAKYGYFWDEKDDREDMWHATNYGKITIQFKEEVRNRTTYTTGDSLNSSWSSNPSKPVPVGEKPVNITTFQSETNLASVKKVKKIADVYKYGGDDAMYDAISDGEASEKDVLGPDYMEAQIHGKLTTADIDKIIVDDPDKLPAKLKKQITDSGIAIVNRDTGKTVNKPVKQPVKKSDPKTEEKPKLDPKPKAEQKPQPEPKKEPVEKKTAKKKSKAEPETTEEGQKGSVDGAKIRGLKIKYDPDTGKYTAGVNFNKSPKQLLNIINHLVKGNESSLTDEDKSVIKKLEAEAAPKPKKPKTKKAEPEPKPAAKEEKKPKATEEPTPEPGKKKIKLYRTLSANTPEQLKAMQSEVFEGKLGRKEAKNGVFGEGLYFYIGEEGEKLAHKRAKVEAWNQAIKDFKSAHADDPMAWHKFMTVDGSISGRARPSNRIKKDPQFAPFYDSRIENSQVITVEIDEYQINGYDDKKRSDRALKIRSLPLADRAAAVEKLGVYDDDKLGEFFIEDKEKQVLIRASKVKEFAATLTNDNDSSVKISPQDKKLIQAYIDWAKSTKSLQSELKDTQENLKKHAAKKPSKKPKETEGNSEQYWKDRALQQKASTLRTGNGFNRAARNDLKGAAKEIEKATAEFYERYAKTEDPEFSLTDVKKLLRGSDKKNWQHTLDEWQELSKQAAEGDEEAEKAVQQEYMQSRVSRIQALEAQMKVIMSKYADNAADGLGKTLGDTYEDTYYRTTYNIQGQKHEYSANFAKIDEDTLKAAIEEDWHGSNFSKKVWDNYTDQLPTMLRESITRGVALGYGPDMLNKQIRTKFNDFSRYNVQRLVNTELGHVVETATMNAYTENNINEYEYMATLEAHTCEQCGNLDGQVFRTQDAQEGLNYPVMHPFCRCTTAPYVDWDWGEDDPGIWMRDPETGKGEIIESMTYNEWKKKFVDGDRGVAYDPSRIDNGGKVSRTVYNRNKNAVTEYLQYDELLREYAANNHIDFKFKNLHDDSVYAETKWNKNINKNTEMLLNTQRYNDARKHRQKVEQEIATGWIMPVDPKYADIYYAVHEVNHVRHNALFEKQFTGEKLTKKERAAFLENWMENLYNEVAEEEGISVSEVKRKYQSKYGRRNIREGFAEIGTAEMLGLSNPLVDKFKERMRD